MAHFTFPIETLLIFLTTVILSVYLDLFAHRNSTTITLPNALLWTAFWVTLALLFYLYLWLRFDKNWANLYLAGYLLEKTLSLDNLMVFMAVFSSFGIKGILQHRILYYGIIGALIFRGLFILIGTKLFLASPWVGFIFAAFILWSAFSMLKNRLHPKKTDNDFSQHWSVRFISRLIPVYPHLYRQRFFLKKSEVDQLKIKNIHLFKHTPAYYITPAFLCLITIETIDFAFAFDSVPAVITVTQEPLLVYTAIIYAILGLRSLYFVFAALTRYLAHLEKAVIALLFFIGLKTALQSWGHITGHSDFSLSPAVNLIIIVIILSIGVIASLFFPPSKKNIPSPH